MFHVFLCVNGLFASYLLLDPFLSCFFPLFLEVFDSSPPSLFLSLSLSLWMWMSVPMLLLFPVPCYSISGIYLLHYFCRSPLCCISLPPVYSPSHSLSPPSYTLSFPDIDLHSSHTAELPVALQWAHLLLFLCVCSAHAGKNMSLYRTSTLSLILKMMFMWKQFVSTFL